MSAVPLQFFDPRRGGVAFKMEELNAATFQKAQRFNYFTLLWITEDTVTLHVDLQHFEVEGPVLICINPYQTFFIEGGKSVRGKCLQFHANFLCIETYHEEIGCNGVLFNDVYGKPWMAIPSDLVAEFDLLLGQIEAELRMAGLAHSEILLSYLKVFLIKATRCKLETQKPRPVLAPQSPPILERLIELIETHYQRQLGPVDYAAMLNMTAKALGKLVKTHLSKTVTTLIRDRTLKHAKWQLLHTRKPVKEVAAEVGFVDELYFSRVFKRCTGLSPSAFREFETAIRGGSNLSMH